MKKELNRFEMAAVKRTAQNVKTMRRKLEKLEEKQLAITTEINQLSEMINDWEQPIIKMSGGLTSEQILNGEVEPFEDTTPPSVDKTYSDEEAVNSWTSVDSSPLNEYPLEVQSVQ